MSPEKSDWGWRMSSKLASCWQISESSPRLPDVPKNGTVSQGRDPDCGGGGGASDYPHQRDTQRCHILLVGRKSLNSTQIHREERPDSTSWRKKYQRICSTVSLFVSSSTSVAFKLIFFKQQDKHLSSIQTEGKITPSGNKW